MHFIDEVIHDDHFTYTERWLSCPEMEIKEYRLLRLGANGLSLVDIL